MKKITFLAVFLMMSVISFGQTELIQDQDFSDGLATVASCSSFTGPLTGTESWWRCGTATIVGTELEYPTDKGPNIRQRISVEADSYYEVSFDIRSDVSGEADGQGFVASFLIWGNLSNLTNCLFRRNRPKKSGLRRLGEISPRPPD